MTPIIINFLSISLLLNFNEFIENFKKIASLSNLYREVPLMYLSAKILKNVENINSWSYKDQWTLRSSGSLGESVDLYFQVIDQDREDIRFMILDPGATASVTFPALGDETFTVEGSFPFPEDRSIIKISLAEDQIPYTGNVRITLNFDGKPRIFSLFNAVRVEKVNSECC